MSTIAPKELEHYYALNRCAWALLAPVYDAMTFMLRGLRHTVVDVVAPSSDARVLDLATGTGAQAAAFAERCRNVVGVDLNPSMLRVARKKRHAPNLQFVQADASSLTFADASFDVTCISFGLHEMPPVIRTRVLAEARRVTREQGRVAIVDYSLPANAWGRSIVFHLVKLYEGEVYADFVRSDLASALAAAGLVVERAVSVGRGTARITIARRTTASEDIRQAPRGPAPE